LPNEADLFQARLGGVSVLGQDRQTGSKAVNLLIQDAQRRPFDGLGKPEPLRHQLAGFGRAEFLANIDLSTQWKVMIS